MTEKRQRMISAMKYILLAIIVGYLVILMLYASGSKRAFSEVSKAVSSVLDSKELVQMDGPPQNPQTPRKRPLPANLTIYQ